MLKGVPEITVGDQATEEVFAEYCSAQKVVDVQRRTEDTLTKCQKAMKECHLHEDAVVLAKITEAQKQVCTGTKQEGSPF